MSLVLERNVGAHLPVPGVVRRERDRPAAADPVVRQDDHRIPDHRTLRLKQRRGAGLQFRRPLVGGERRQRGPELVRLLPVVAQERRRVAPPLRRQIDPQIRHQFRATLVGRPVMEHDRRELGKRSAGKAALGKGPPTAQEQHAATALAGEVDQHPHLVVSEETRLHAAQDDAAVLEQLLAPGRKPLETPRVLVEVHAVELVGRLPRHRHDVQVLVLADRPPQELRLVARLALEEEDLLPPLQHFHQGGPLVVQQQFLVRLAGNLKPELPGALVVRREHHAGRDGRAATRERHLLQVDDPAVVLDLQVHGAAAEPRLGQRDLDLDR